MTFRVPISGWRRRAETSRPWGAAGGRGPRPRPLAAIALEQGPSCRACAGSCILFILRPSSIVVVPQPGHREPRGLALASGDVSPSVSEAYARDARGSPWPRAGTNVPWRPGLARRAGLLAGRRAPSRPRGHGTAYFPVMSSSAAAGSNTSARTLLPRLWALCASPSAHERALVPKDRLCLLVRWTPNARGAVALVPPALRLPAHPARKGQPENRARKSKQRFLPSRFVLT